MAVKTGGLIDRFIVVGIDSNQQQIPMPANCCTSYGFTYDSTTNTCYKCPATYNNTTTYPYLITATGTNTSLSQQCCPGWFGSYLTYQTG